MREKIGELAALDQQLANRFVIELDTFTPLHCHDMILSKSESRVHFFQDALLFVIDKFIRS